MSRNKTILLRVQSPEGTKRVEIDLTDTTCQLYEKVHNLFNLNSFAFALYRQKSQKDEIPSSRSRTLVGVGLRHGDMIFLAPTDGARLFSDEPIASSSRNNKPFGEPAYSSEGNTTANSSNYSPRIVSSTSSKSNIQEDEVDLQLAKVEGRIERKRDDKLCRHNVNAKCVHCSPLEAYDEAYLQQQNIKHLSFHAYLRKLTSGVDRGKFVALEDISCRIKNGCKDHPPWPKGICSKCQPNAITLNRQPYRHVDNITFENTHLVERFLNYWRATGHQRIGLLYGNYEIYNDVPLGIRANVAAIYEPPQEGSRDSIRLLKDDKAEIVDGIAVKLGLKKVGWVFTDLIPEDVQKGTVKYIRSGASHFLTAQECIMAGHFQNMHPNPCKFSSSGYFGSKFVTVCITGDKDNQVHMEGYQVSNQCMALVRDNCIVPTKDVPELAYVKESSDKQYVPDVYYKEKDSYGNEVPRLARPLPIEYLLVDVPTSTPLTPQYSFSIPDNSKQPFPVENRLVDGHIQDFNVLSRYLSQFTPNDFLTAISDFHVLTYIATMDMLPMRDYMDPLLEAVKNKDPNAAREWSRSEHWATVEQLIAASNTSPPNSRPGSVDGATSPSSRGNQWTCPFCTFLNPSQVNNCEMCNLPRNMPQ